MRFSSEQTAKIKEIVEFAQAGDISKLLEIIKPLFPQAEYRFENCSECSKVFFKNHGKKEFCSKRCGNRRRAREFRKSNQVKIKQINDSI